MTNGVFIGTILDIGTIVEYFLCAEERRNSVSCLLCLKYVCGCNGVTEVIFRAVEFLLWHEQRREQPGKTEGQPRGTGK